MSGLRRFFPAILLLLLLPFLWAGAFRAGGELQALPSCTLLRYHTRSVMPDELRRMEESEAENESALPFSAFSQLDAQTVQGKLYGRRAQADILLFYGDLRRILPAGLPSDFTFSADGQGCALDRDTAFSLWGSEQVIGETLLVNEKEYTVRAVLDAPKGTVAIPASPEDGLSVFALSVPAGEDERLQAEQFYSRHGLPAPEAATTGGWHAFFSRALCLLPALLPLGALLIAILRELWGMRETPVLCGVWVLAVALLLVGLFRLSGVHFSLPQSMVPTRWSDFEFWNRLFHSFWENLCSALLTPVLAPDRMAGKAWIKLLLCSLTAAADMAALMILYRKRRAERG